MTHLITQDPQAFKEALDTWLAGAQRIVNRRHGENTQHSHLNPVLTLEPGRKFIKVVESNAGSGSRSVFAFIAKETGDVLKPAGWAAPAKHARGNIFNSDNGLDCVGPYSIAYLR